MLNKLKDYRTKIMGYLTAAQPVLIILGIQFDPQMVVDYLSNHYVSSIAGQFLTSYGVHYFRDRASDAKPAQVEPVVHEPYPASAVDIEATQSDFSRLEEELTELQIHED